MSEGEKRLKFLESLLANTCTSKHELARIMEVSPQNIFTYFQRDDMKLSYAQEIASRLGYNLVFSLESEVKPSGRILLDIESIVGDEGLNRLAFLQIAMKLHGITRRQLAEELGLNYTGINRWFRVDDMALSYLFRIAELHGLKVCIRAEKKRVDPGVMNLS